MEVDPGTLKQQENENWNKNKSIRNGSPPNSTSPKGEESVCGKIRNSNSNNNLIETLLKGDT